jgi:hypothetical protein
MRYLFVASKAIIFLFCFVILPGERDCVLCQTSNPTDVVQGAVNYDNFRINQDQTDELQNEQQIAVNPKNGKNVVAVWRDFRLGYRRVGVGYSFDSGRTWTEDLFEEYHYPWHSDPGITVNADGVFHAVILSYTSTYQTNGLFVYNSYDGGVSWEGPFTVIDGVNNVFEDKELIACDRTDNTHSGNVYVAWARFGYDTQIMCCTSTDGGENFAAPVRVSDSSGVQWPVPVVAANGDLLVAWNTYWPSSIKIDRSTNGGVSFGSDKTLSSVNVYPGSSINGGITVFPFPAMDADITGGTYHGNVYVAYMDEQDGNDADIYFRKSIDNGDTWGSRTRLNDDPVNNGCDQFHPWLCVDNLGIITAIWLDRRLDSNNMLYDCYMAKSFDGGDTWSRNVRLSTESSDPRYAMGDEGGDLSPYRRFNDWRDEMAHRLRGKSFRGSKAAVSEMLFGRSTFPLASSRAGLLGEYIGVASFNGRVYPIWTDIRNLNQDAFFAVPVP